MPNNTITNNLQRLITAKSDIANAIITMGGECDESHGLEDFPNDILTIPSGGPEEIIGTASSSQWNLTVTGTVKQLDKYIRVDLEFKNTSSKSCSLLSGTSICTLMNLQLTGLTFSKKWYYNGSYNSSSVFFSASFGSNITSTSVNLIMDAQKTWYSGTTLSLGMLYELRHT